MRDEISNGAMGDCIFCKIAKREIPAEVVYEDDCALAFLDIKPRSPGHTIVIPKIHSPSISELDDGLVGPLFVAVKRVGTIVKNALGAPGITYGINQGRASGQEVNHIHVHIMPRLPGDGGGPVQVVVDNPPKEDLGEIARKIRNANRR